jgi:hypothetical protein
VTEVPWRWRRGQRLRTLGWSGLLATEASGSFSLSTFSLSNMSFGKGLLVSKASSSFSLNVFAERCVFWKEDVVTVTMEELALGLAVVAVEVVYVYAAPALFWNSVSEGRAGDGGCRTGSGGRSGGRRGGTSWKLEHGWGTPRELF